MSDIFRIPSDRQPWLTEGTPFISRPWYLFLQGLFTRSGSSTGTPVEDVEFDGVGGDGSDQDFVFMQQIQAMNLAPVVQQLEQQVNFLEAALASSRDEIAELRRTVEGIMAGTVI